MARVATQYKDAGTVDFVCTGTVTVGDVVPFGTNGVGVALVNGAAGQTIAVQTEGIFDITGLGTDTAAIGDKVYWDNTNKRCTVTSTSNAFAGYATLAKTNGDTTFRVALNGLC